MTRTRDEQLARMQAARTAWQTALDRLDSLQARLDTEVASLHRVIPGAMTAGWRYTGAHVKFTATEVFRLANAVLDASMVCDRCYFYYRDEVRGNLFHVPDV